MGGKSVYPGPRLRAGPFLSSPPRPGLKNAPSTTVFIWPPRPQQEPGIGEEPDTPVGGRRARSCSGHPYGKGRSPSAALPSANPWVAGAGVQARPTSPGPTTPGRVPGAQRPPLPAAGPHVLGPVCGPAPRPRPPLAAPRLPPLPPSPLGRTRLGLHVTCGGRAPQPERALR